METVGARLLARRKQLGWTQGEVARKAGISVGFLSNLENGKRSVGAAVLYELARVLGLSLDSLMSGTDGGVATAETRDIEVPRTLAEFAAREGVSFRHTLLLMDLQRRILAARVPGKRTPRQNLEAVDWPRFHAAIRSFL